MQKRRYRIRNWAQYNRALIQRGSITVWIEDQALTQWFSSNHTGQAGHPEVYSDEAILMMLIIRETFKLTLRALHGFIGSLLNLMDVALPVPSYSQISRRAQSLHKRIGRLANKRARHLVFDSTGLKVYGEGEWKVKVHGKAKRRTWRKLHIILDPETHDIVACEMTENSKGDSGTAVEMMKQIPGEIEAAYGDGAYDDGRFRKEIHKRKGKCLVPPPRRARYKGAQDGWERARDETLAEIKGLGGDEEGRALWKKLSGYHQRSLGETAFMRMKKMLGGNLKARSMGAQRTESICKCLVINKMNKLGLPKGKWVGEAA